MSQRPFRIEGPLLRRLLGTRYADSGPSDKDLETLFGQKRLMKEFEHTLFGSFSALDATPYN